MPGQILEDSSQEGDSTGSPEDCTTRSFGDEIVRRGPRWQPDGPEYKGCMKFEVKLIV